MGLVFFLGSGLLTGTGAGEWTTGWDRKAGKGPETGKSSRASGPL